VLIIHPAIEARRKVGKSTTAGVCPVAIVLPGWEKYCCAIAMVSRGKPFGPLSLLLTIGRGSGVFLKCAAYLLGPQSRINLGSPKDRSSVALNYVS
jgi:hypothetical protein